MSTYDLRVTEIFHSLQGESNLVGLPTVFIRLTGCPLRCQYCDTAYAFSGGQKIQLDEILKQVSAHGAQYVCVTGGEPLAQPNCHFLLKALCDAGYTVSLETSGAMDISTLDPRVRCILDIKTPGSAEMDKNLLSNFAHLQDNDQIKFVICNREDFDFAKQLIQDHSFQHIDEILFSPSFHELEASVLAQWILDEGLNVRLQVQLHKILWGEKKGV